MNFKRKIANFIESAFSLYDTNSSIRLATVAFDTIYFPFKLFNDKKKASLIAKTPSSAEHQFQSINLLIRAQLLHTYIPLCAATHFRRRVSLIMPPPPLSLIKPLFIYFVYIYITLYSTDVCAPLLPFFPPPPPLVASSLVAWRAEKRLFHNNSNCNQLMVC